MPALWKRSRRTGFRAVAVVCAIAAVAYCTAAVTAAPARADQPVSYGGPYALTEPSGDLTGSMDVAGIDPADMSSFLNSYWAEAVGLPAGASLNDVIQATWQKYSGTWSEDPSTEGMPEPPSVPDMSASVASDGSGGSIVTIDVPAPDVQANWTLPGWAVSIITTLIGIAAAVVTFAICQLIVVTVGTGTMVAAGPGGAVILGATGTLLCSSLASGAWTAAAVLSGHLLQGEPWSAKDSWDVLVAGVLAAMGSAFIPKMAAGLIWLLKKFWQGLVSAATAIANFVKPYLGSAFDAFASALKRGFGRAGQEVEDSIPLLELPGLNLGGPAFEEGFFEHFPGPSSSVGALCMDAYGANGNTAPVGQPVAINDCNGNPAQEWDFYTNGMVANFGMCMDTTGGTSSSGTPLVDLEPCDGSASQTWTQVGSTVVNQADSDCLDDQGGNTTPGTQLDVAPCDGSAAQNWLSPKGEPCDIYASYGTPCAAAYSTTRAMYAGYDGPLYQVTRTSDGTTRDIGLLTPGGDVDASQQDSFCPQTTTCTITTIYDQTPDGNNLTPGPGGEADSTPDKPADAAALPITIGGNEAYGVDIEQGIGYRDDATTGIATGSDPEGMYMVTSGTHVNSTCCFDFGNAEANNDDNYGGHMDAVNFGLHCFTDYGATCSGSGPWVQADLENGLFQGSRTNPNNYTGNNSDFVTAMLKNNGTDTFALKGGDSQGGGLTKWYDGALPPPQGVNKWAPMSKEGAIILGIGGDNSNGGVGSFFEGVMTDGYPTDAADAAVQANIVAAGYKGDSAGTGGTSQVAGPAVVHSAGAPSTSPGGYTSVFTVDAKNGHLQESYLTSMGALWHTQDLSATGGDLPGTPPVKPDTRPVAVVHCGYTSVFTVDASDNHLQETYLPAIGGPWHTQDLSATGTNLPGTPPTKVTPTAVVHFAGATGASAACGYTSVYTIDASNGHLQETYLPLLGGPWSTQDLTAQTPAPAAQPGTSPVSIVHDGYVSVFTVGTDHDIWETYLSNIGNLTWGAHDLTAIAQPPGPQTTSTVTAVVHQGYLSVYAAGDPLRHLWELYLPAIGDNWHSQDLSATGTDLPATPPVAPGTSPVALYHTGYTSVFTVDQGTMDLRETYLSNLGNTWATHDLSATGGTLPGTPQTTETPMVVVHPDTSGALTWTSVFTVNHLDNDLQETYLPAIGDDWTTQDLTFMTKGPPVMVNASPTATWSVANNGYTYVFSLDPDTGHLVVSYLTATGATWQTEDLTAAGQAPTPSLNTTPVAVAWDGHVTVFTVGNAKGDLWQTTLPANGGTWTGTDLTATTGGPPTAVTPTALFHGGYLSAYTVDDGNNVHSSGDLEEYYLPLGSATWAYQDLTTLTSGTQVDPETSPVALYHDGYTSVFTNDNESNHLRETYLTAIGNNWATHDLTSIGGAPVLASYSTPAALYHSGYTSVYELDQGGAVWETYLTAIGNNWTSQNLTAKYTVPTVPVVNGETGVSVKIPSTLAAVYHSGYASIYTVDVNGDVHESFLPAISDSWQTQDLTQNASPHIPGTISEQPPSPLVHYDTNGGLTWTSLYTINGTNPLTGSPPSGSLQETYLPKIGDNWTTQGLPN